MNDKVNIMLVKTSLKLLEISTGYSKYFKDM